jgi:phage gpG-like protein
MARTTLEITRTAGPELSQRIIRAMYSALTVIGNVAAGKYMIQTGTSKRSGLPGVDVAVDPVRLTWRTARLARSLTNPTNPEAVHSVRVDADGKVVGEKGTMVPYAAIHEQGGTISHPGGTAYIVTGKGARFISNAKAAKYSRPKSIRRTRPHMITIPARPFLAPAINDKGTQDGIISIFAEEVGKFIGTPTGRAVYKSGR